MAAETFFARWSRRKSEANQEVAAVPVVPEADAPTEDAPTLEQVAALGVHDDFTPFVARGVDETVRRAAMKKIFSDPHFNVMDGLDTYIEDYHKFVPMTATMIAALNHAKDLLDPLATIAREEAANAGRLPPSRAAMAPVAGNTAANAQAARAAASAAAGADAAQAADAAPAAGAAAAADVASAAGAAGRAAGGSPTDAGTVAPQGARVTIFPAESQDADEHTDQSL